MNAARRASASISRMGVGVALRRAQAVHLDPQPAHLDHLAGGQRPVRDRNRSGHWSP